MSNRSKPTKRLVMHMNYPLNPPENPNINLQANEPEKTVDRVTSSKTRTVTKKRPVRAHKRPVVVRKCNCGKGFL